MNRTLYIVNINNQEFTGENLHEVLFQAYVHGQLPAVVEKVTVLEDGSTVSTIMPINKANQDNFLEKMFKEILK